MSQSGDCSTCLAARGDRSQRTAGPALSATPGWGPWPDQLPCQLPSWLVPPLETKARQTPMDQRSFQVESLGGLFWVFLRRLDPSDWVSPWVGAPLGKGVVSKGL